MNSKDGQISDQDIKALAWIFVIALSTYLILYPVFATPNEHFYGRICLSSQKQLIVGTEMYSTDCDDLFPHNFTFDLPPNWAKMSLAEQKMRHPAIRFKRAVLDYIKDEQVFLCPNDDQESKIQDLVVGREGFPKVMTYVHSLSLKGAIPGFVEGARLLNASSIPRPEIVPFLRDPLRGFGPNKYGRSAFLSPHKWIFNISYLDGHCKATESLDPNTQL